MMDHYELLLDYHKIECKILKASDLVDEKLSGKEEIKEILIKTGASLYVSGNNCIIYGVNKDYLNEINVDLELIDFKQEQKRILRSKGIDLKYSLLHTYNNRN